MPRVEFVNQSAHDSDNVAANPARLLNLYPVPVADGANARTTMALKSVLGQDAKSNVAAAIRAMGRANGKNWVAAGGSLFELLSDGTTTSRGTIADDVNTTIAGNGSDVTIVAGNNYYIYDGAISQPTTKTFTNVGSHCYVGSYTVLTEKDGKRFQWSAVGDAGTLNALHFASADKVDDNIIRAVEYAGNLLVMCQTSTEIWQIDPDAAVTSRFVYASMTNTGLRKHNLLVRFDDALAFTGNDGRVYIFGQGVISTPSVETSIGQNDPTHMFYYEDEGQKFIVLRFSDRPAWVYDMATGLWHERAENATYARWRAVASLRGAGGGGAFSPAFSSAFPTGSNAWYLGNSDGDIIGLSRSNRDLGAPLYRRAVSRSLYLGDRKFSISKAELVARMGDHLIELAEDFGLSLGDGFGLSLGGSDILLVDSIPAGERDANVDLYESFDGGRTWRGPFSRSMGRCEDYTQRMVWRARGQAQQYTMRFDLSDPADLTLYADGYVTAL